MEYLKIFAVFFSQNFKSATKDSIKNGIKFVLKSISTKKFVYTYANL